MLILGLLGMYFDAAVVFVTKSSLFFRLAVAILCLVLTGQKPHKQVRPQTSLVYHLFLLSPPYTYNNFLTAYSTKIVEIEQLL